MSATATQHPVIPPRPSRSTEKPAMPVIPPRPSKNRSVSPNPDRFAPSPLNDPSPFSHKSPRSSLLGVESIGEPIERSTSVDLPSVGQEGIEYDNIASERSRSNSPEQTRTVGADVKLHAPKPSLPAASAKQRVMAVTRTDSDKAASYGIGKPSSTDGLSGPPYGSTKKKASTTSQLSNGENPNDEEHGIPEIGRQVPMYPNAGDVQAPSPAPQQDGKKHHARKTSARGTLPPGSYGLHGHGVAPQDKLEKAYFEKHPDLLKKEHTPHHHDRANDFSMSSDELNKIVRDTARSTGLDTNYAGTPGEHIGWQALEESTSRVASPMPVPIDPKSPVKATFRPGSLDKDVIHVDEPNSRRRSVMFNEDGNLESDDGYRAPILADDEVEKNPPAYEQPAAVELERRGSQSDEAVSRPTSRPASLYKEVSFEHQSTPLEDVEEYEPLFPEDEKADAKKDPKVDEIKSEHKQRFPSQDIWEDAPSSLHYTAEVSTPDLPEQREAAEGQPRVSPPPRSGETPAQAFARQQEELAEKEATERGVDGFLPGHIKHRPLWAQQQQNPASGTSISRPSMTQRFPSRDVWEDTPDSLKLETTVSAPDDTEEGAPVDTKPDIPQRPQRKQASEPSSATSDSQKPSIPERPKPKQTSNDDGSRPVVPDRPKPQIPSRPVKAGPTSGGLEPADAAAPPRQKPAVPSRPMGSKIAALQAGFMSDLNNRLRLGPQGPKKEEPAAEEAPVEEKEKAPLSDARKGRARGPQRRAPAKSSSPAAAAAEEEVKAAPAFSFSIPTIVFEIDPEEGDLSVADLSIPEPTEVKEEKAVGSSAAVSVAVDGPSEKKELSVDEVKPIATNTAGEPVLEVVSSKEEDVKPTEAE